MTRIIAVRVRPVCIVFSCIYAVVGLLAFIQYCYLDAMTQFTFPIGIIAPFVGFNFNLHIPREVTAAYAVGAVLAYAVSGWISGMVGTYFFNLIAGVMGGIDARFVKTEEGE